MCSEIQNVIDISKLSKLDKKIFKNKYDAIFFDLDGTLSRLDSSPIPGAREAVSAIADSGKEMFVLTDRGELARSELAQRIRLEFPEIPEKNVITSQWLLTHYLKKIGFNKKIYTIGSERGIIKELKDAGFIVLYDNDKVKIDCTKDLFDIQLDEDVGAVVMGMDYNFSYLKLFKSANYLKNSAMHFILSYKPLVVHRDPIIPGVYAMASPIEQMTGRRARICGKASSDGADYLRSLGYDVKRCLFVGDSPESDVDCGNRAGMDTLFVLSGSFTRDDLHFAAQRGLKTHIPTYIADSVAQLTHIYT